MGAGAGGDGAAAAGGAAGGGVGAGAGDGAAAAGAAVGTTGSGLSATASVEDWRAAAASAAAWRPEVRLLVGGMRKLVLAIRWWIGPLAGGGEAFGSVARECRVYCGEGDGAPGRYKKGMSCGAARQSAV